MHQWAGRAGQRMHKIHIMRPGAMQTILRVLHDGVNWWAVSNDQSITTNETTESIALLSDYQRTWSTPQRCEFNMKHVVLYVGHMYKPFWTKTFWPGWQGGSGKIKIGQNVDQNGPRFWLWSPLEAPKWVKDPRNGFWSKMACTSVPHIVLHVSCWTRTSGRYFWPSEDRFRGILALWRDWFYNGHIENLG